LPEFTAVNEAAVSPSIFIKAIHAKQEKILLKTRILNLKHNLEAGSKDELQLIVGTKQGEYRFPPCDIIRCEADSNYTMIYSSENNKFMASKTPGDTGSKLAGSGFLRVHKSHLVNPNYIAAFQNPTDFHFRMSY